MIEHLKGIAVHMAIMGILMAGGFYYLFYVYLPVTTNHGETITVPDLDGISLDEVMSRLENTTLEYVVIDSTTYNPRYESLTVMSQVPNANTLVKENRKIYLTINARNVPLVALPKLKDRYLRDALITLESYGFVRDSIVYRPSNSPLVLQQYYQGKAVKEGDKLPRGAKIKLVVGIQEGLGEIPVPDLIGRHYKGLKDYLETQGLLLSQKWVDDDEYPENHVFWQSPAPGDSNTTTNPMIKVGAIIDVKIAGTEPKKDTIQ